MKKKEAFVECPNCRAQFAAPKQPLPHAVLRNEQAHCKDCDKPFEYGTATMRWRYVDD